MREGDAEFFSEIFAGLSETMAMLLDDYEAFYGHEFKRADVQWHEHENLSGWPFVYKLTWRGLCLLELHMAPADLVAECGIVPRCRRH